jgi:hypothetical protein
MSPIDKSLCDLKLQDFPNISATVIKLGVNHSTLSRNFNEITKLRHVANKLSKCKLFPPQKEILVDYINNLSVQSLPPMVQMIWNFVFDIAKVQVRKNWPQNFIKHY